MTWKLQETHIVETKMNKLLAALIFFAVLPLPYAYYEILRVAVCLGVVFIVVKEWKSLDTTAKAILAVIAILFNPFSPIYLSKMVWVVIDLVVGLYMLNLKLDGNNE